MLYVLYPDVDIWNYMLEDYDGKGNIVTMPLNRNCSKWQLVIRKLFPTLTSSIYMLFGSKICKMLRSLKEGDSFLICDYTDLCIIKTITKDINPSVKKSLWLWNPAKDYDMHELKNSVISSCGFEIYTFDKCDSEKYGYTLLPQFSKEPATKGESCIEQDFYFMGFEKGRKQILEELRNDLKGYNVNFKTINVTEEGISYSTNINNIQKSRCLVEIVQGGQAGLTLRPLEAMFMKKKLLTNNKNIKFMDFYSPKNIFIYGEDDIADIDNFLNSDFEKIPTEVQYKYSIDCWISNFIK